MADILKFPGTAPKEDNPGYIAGPAKCIRCQYKWAAVTPAGVTQELECPHCHAETGILLGVIEPPGDRWVCKCGNQLFFLTATGAPLCAGCGLRAVSWAD